MVQVAQLLPEPYEQRIETLKEGESVTLEFELIKEDVRDVVVELTYSGVIRKRQEYPPQTGRTVYLRCIGAPL